MIGITELIIILVVAGTIFFGGKRIGELGRALGKFTGEFKKGKIESEKEIEAMKKEIEEIKK
ncbi:MAG: translocase [Candidatus Portnoybacteria bacterium CG06_land_8_20_14_3_00_39_12]|uniref:Translocase n=1 Tax=Candidatus Portnoybacteria bacterium CG06_land_8_20_14_3_00_39_12 TaxID=1974809 RepID=A0A2M7AWZ7_9BACT|nr:MAG: translocase [Candidatus Portnoybacteria bacterium CG06_land_8_20_14_3_00_39_12]